MIMQKRRETHASKITEVYGKETYEFRENSIVVSMPFAGVRLDENTQDDTQVDAETRILSFCVLLLRPSE